MDGFYSDVHDASSIPVARGHLEKYLHDIIDFLVRGNLSVFLSHSYPWAMILIMIGLRLYPHFTRKLGASMKFLFIGDEALSVISRACYSPEGLQ
jgi:hypothetical protein